MKSTKTVGRAFALGCILVVSLFVFSVGRQARADDSGGESVCLRALERCGFDALVALFSAGPLAGAGYSASCIMGYEFCERYVNFI